MIECVFTLDYEIYGNGEGSLPDLVLDPTRRLAEVFRELQALFVVFAGSGEFARSGFSCVNCVQPATKSLSTSIRGGPTRGMRMSTGAWIEANEASVR